MKKLLHPRKRFEATVLSNELLTPTVCETILQIPKDCSDFCYTSGQYVTLQTRIDGKPISRSYSIASAYQDTLKMEFCIKKVEEGILSPHIFDWKAGEKVKVTGPMGNFIIEDSMLSKPITFIATGTGIAPFRAMIQSLTEAGQMRVPKINLFSGVRYVNEVLYDKEWNALKEKYGDRFFYAATVSRPEREDHNYSVGRVGDVLKKHREVLDGSLFFICGLTPMIDDVKSLLLSMDFSEESIFYEKYD